MPSALTDSGRPQFWRPWRPLALKLEALVQSSCLLRFVWRRGRWSKGPDHVFILAWRISVSLIAVTFSPSPGLEEPEGKQPLLLSLEQVCKVLGTESESPNLSPASCSSSLKPQPPKSHQSGLLSVFVGCLQCLLPLNTFLLWEITSLAPPGFCLFSPSPPVVQQRHGAPRPKGRD